MTLAPDYEFNEEKHMKSILVGTNIGNIIQFYISEDKVDVPIFTNELGDNYGKLNVDCIFFPTVR